MIFFQTLAYHEKDEKALCVLILNKYMYSQKDDELRQSLKILKSHFGSNSSKQEYFFAKKYPFILYTT